jgi:ATP-dependent protease Clp ATPase subunit
MVCGPTASVAICNECVEVCTDIIAEQRGEPTQSGTELRFQLRSHCARGVVLHMFGWDSATMPPTIM